MNLEDRETTTVIMNTNEYTNAYSKLMATDTRTNDWSNELFDVHERKSDTSGDTVYVIGERNAHSISVLHLCVCVCMSVFWIHCGEKLAARTNEWSRTFCFFVVAVA